MDSLQEFQDKQGAVSGQQAPLRFILKDPKALAIFLEVAKEAESKHISDTIAAKYLTQNYDIFKHLNYNTVRRYFRDFRDGVFE
jgi:hypothetical protein|tara:strand:+ start:79 stop:330 length:252 start_codon:yes stop_codon:yes gene_type:complete